MAKPFNKLKFTGILGLDDPLPFGRHLGYTVLTILKDRPQYISWLVANTSVKFYPSVHNELYKYLATYTARRKKRSTFPEDYYDDMRDMYDVGCEFGGLFDDVPF